MPKSSIERYIVALHDANLSEQIVYVASTLDEITAVIERAGSWQPAPDTGAAILLGEPEAWVFVDSPPWHADDDLTARIEGATPSHIIDIGPRGGIRIRRDY